MYRGKSLGQSREIRDRSRPNVGLYIYCEFWEVRGVHPLQLSLSDIAPHVELLRDRLAWQCYQELDEDFYEVSFRGLFAIFECFESFFFDLEFPKKVLQQKISLF